MMSGQIMHFLFVQSDPDEQSVSERWINLESDESQIRLLPCGGMSFSSCGVYTRFTH